MTDNLGFGPEKRRQGNLDILAGKTTFRFVYILILLLPSLTPHPSDAFREMLESVVANGHSFEECKEVLKQSAHRLPSPPALADHRC